MRTIRIGSGAGYSGDRIEPAIELAEKGDIQYLVFECLGERTVALAQQARMKNPDSGYDPLLEERMRAVLPICAAKGIKIVTNMGAANPEAAARKTADIARSLGLSALKVAAVVDRLGLRLHLRGSTGLLVDERDVDGLADAIRRFVRRSKLRSLSTLASNTGGVHPCWRASTTSSR